MIMNQPKSSESIVVPIVYTYRYIWKDTNGKLFVKYITEPQEGHRTFQETIRQDPKIVSCAREYINEVNFTYIGFTEPVKEESKNNEKE